MIWNSKVSEHFSIYQKYNSYETSVITADTTTISFFPPKNAGLSPLKQYVPSLLTFHAVLAVYDARESDRAKEITCVYIFVRNLFLQLRRAQSNLTMLIQMTFHAS